MSTLTHEEHRERHRVLHKHLDELLGDFIRHTGLLPSQVSLLQFMEWSFGQIHDPTELPPE